jgi:nucleotide-binding universal stress UspA family protein
MAYDTILVPTDGSAGTERTVTHAEELARVHAATIHALYVVDATSFTGLPMETSWEGIRGMLEEKGETALEQVERLVADVPVETSVVEGTPNREIVRFAAEHPVDAIVMGTHGRGGIDRLLLGSVAERVVRGAPVPVVTINVSEATALDDETGDAAEAGAESDPGTSTEPATPGPD